MKRGLSLVLFLLVACTRIPEGFDEPKLKEEAQGVVEHLEAMDAGWAIDKMRDDLEILLVEEDLLKILVEKYDRVGCADSKLKYTISDVKDSTTDELYAVVIVAREYTKGKGTYTLSFDTNYDLVGLYIK